MPHARIVYDKFHVLRRVNDALDETRRAEFFRQGDATRAALPGSSGNRVGSWQAASPRLSILLQRGRELFRQMAQALRWSMLERLQSTCCCTIGPRKLHRQALFDRIRGTRRSQRPVSVSAALLSAAYFASSFTVRPLMFLLGANRLRV